MTKGNNPPKKKAATPPPKGHHNRHVPPHDQHHTAPPHAPPGKHVNVDTHDRKTGPEHTQPKVPVQPQPKVPHPQTPSHPRLQWGDQEQQPKKKGPIPYNDFLFLQLLQERLMVTEIETPGMYGAASNTIDEILAKINQTRDQIFKFMIKDGEGNIESSEVSELALEIIDDLLDLGEDPKYAVLYERLKYNIILNPKVTHELLCAADDIVERTFAKAWEVGHTIGMYDKDHDARKSIRSGGSVVTSLSTNS